MKSPISILFPCYLINPWLREALISIEASAKDIVVECLIVANNMNETEVQKLQNLCREILTIDFKIVNAGKTDLVGALNFGLRESKYEYIARFDQDDLMLPNRLMLQRDFLDSHPDHSLVGGAVEIISEVGAHIDFHAYPITPESILFNLARGNCFAHPGVMFLKSKVIDVGGYSSVFAHAEDYDLFIRLNRVSKSSNLQETVIKYRQNSNQVSNIFRLEQALSTRVLIIEQVIYKLGLETLFPLPAENSELATWVREITIAAGERNVSKLKITRDEQTQLKRAISTSHFAIARSTGYKGNRDLGTIMIELLQSFLWSPKQLLLEVLCVLKPHK